MKKIKLLSLSLDGNVIHFKSGVNYIVGPNASGKTTIFNCIKYTLGVLNTLNYNEISSFQLRVTIGELEFEFKRNVNSRKLNVVFGDVEHLFMSGSSELERFYKDVFGMRHIYNSETESILNVLDFCFMTETKSRNRRQELSVIKSMLGVNVGLIKVLEKEISSLKNEVSQDKKKEVLISEFSEQIIHDFDNSGLLNEVTKSVNLSRLKYIEKYREKEIILQKASHKFSEIVERSNCEFEGKVKYLESEFIRMKEFLGINTNGFNNFEKFVIDRNSSVSYSEDVLSRFLLILVLSKLAEEFDYNFPGLIVNDGYLSGYLDERVYYKSRELVNDLVGVESNVQYLEFTYRDDLVKDDVILNLKGHGGLYEF